MRKYHCGGTDRSIDTLQVESKQEKIQKKQKHICKKIGIVNRRAISISGQAVTNIGVTPPLSITSSLCYY